MSDGVAEANPENRLTGIFQDIDDLPRRCFEIEVRAVREQVDVGGATDDVRQALLEFPVQKAHDLSYSLE